MSFKTEQNIYHKQVNTVIKSLFVGLTEKGLHKLLIRFGANIHNSIIITTLLTAMNLSGTVKIFVVVIAIVGIIKLLNIH